MTKARGGISTWEWVAAAVSAAMIVAIVVTLVLHGRRADTPPDLVVTVGEIKRVTAGYLAMLSIRNSGGATAAHVIVEGVLVARGDAERSQATFDYVPDGSVQEGALMFTRNPGDGQLAVRVLGYREP